jgi:hypothetical protein
MRWKLSREAIGLADANCDPPVADGVMPGEYVDSALVVERTIKRVRLERVRITRTPIPDCGVEHLISVLSLPAIDFTNPSTPRVESTFQVLYVASLNACLTGKPRRPNALIWSIGRLKRIPDLASEEAIE